MALQSSGIGERHQRHEAPTRHTHSCVKAAAFRGFLRLTGPGGLVRVRTLKIMFGTFRKHQSWLLVTIIAAMILGLVIYFNPSASSGPRGPGEQLGTIDGEKVTRTDYINTGREVQLAYLIRRGAWPNDSSFDLESQIYQRLFLLKKIKDHQIHVDEESVAQAARNILAQLGGGQPIPVETFVKEILAPNATEQDFVRYIRNELALQQLFSVVGISSEFVTPQEARQLYIRENQEIATHVVFYSGTNYQTSVGTPTEEELKTFYTNQIFAYRQPEQIQLNYVSFAASNFYAQADTEIAGITNLNQLVDLEYERLGTNAFPEAKIPEEAKAKIRADHRKQVALRLAYGRAVSFMDELLAKDPVVAENLNILARSNNLVVKTTAPFDAQNGPSELDSGEFYAQAAFRLTPQEPFPDQPFSGSDEIYVVALAKRIPSEIQPYETVKDQVASDYRRSRSIETARRAGNDFARALADGLGTGKTFNEIVSGAHVKAVALPPVSLSTTNVAHLEGLVNLNQFKNVAFDTQPGKASNFSPTADGGFVVYVEKRLPLDEAKISAELPAFTRLVRQARREEAINAWFQREASQSLRDTPLMQRQQPGGRS